MARELDLFEYVTVAATRMPDAVFTTPDDDWTPVMFMEGKKGRATTPLAEYMDSDRSKDILAELMIPMLVREFEAETVVMVLSSWTSKASSTTYMETGEYVSPSKQADREERVLVVEYTREGVTRQAWAKIQRFADKVPQLGEWSDLGAVGVEGRFVGPIVDALREVSPSTEYREV